MYAIRSYYAFVADDGTESIVYTDDIDVVEDVEFASDYEVGAQVEGADGNTWERITDPDTGEAAWQQLNLPNENVDTPTNNILDFVIEDGFIMYDPEGNSEWSTPFAMPSTGGDLIEKFFVMGDGTDAIAVFYSKAASNVHDAIWKLYKDELKAFFNNLVNSAETEGNSYNFV